MLLLTKLRRAVLFGFVLLVGNIPSCQGQNQAFDTIAAGNRIRVEIGDDPSSTLPNVGWTDGVCYQPIVHGVDVGDTLEFRFEAHNVYKMASREHFNACNFSEATLLAQVGESPFRYTIEPESLAADFNIPGAEETLYFACQVGDHCASGTQKIQVTVGSSLGDMVADARPIPPSPFLLGLTEEECRQVQDDGESVSELALAQTNSLRSTCEDPVPVEGQPGTYTRTCLSGPATLTPGGVVNRLFVLHYPFPTDHRVALGQRTFDFVVDNPENPEAKTVVDHRQLYIHHLAGRVVFSQGAESMGNEDPDAPFPKPYARITGNDGPMTIFHLIDLREVDDWLSCIECRCPSLTGMTYLDQLSQTGNATGGVSCCTNCTDLAGPTLDYRMRYNVTYRELTEEAEAAALEGNPDMEPLVDVDLLIADIAPAVDMLLEYDVPSYQFLPADQQADDNPFVQRLERVAPFNEMFQVSFFAGPYNGPDEVVILRCVAHMHVAAITQYLEDAETGERFCTGNAVYGTTPGADDGFVTAVTVDNHDPPIIIPANRKVRFVTEYNATHVHTGVMGYLFVFVAGENQVTADVMNLTVPLCLQPTCDASLLPSIDMEPYKTTEASTQGDPGSMVDLETGDGCSDTLSESPTCSFGGLCECEEFVNAPESTGCGGVYESAFGDLEVNSLCAKYCGCNITKAVEEVEQGMQEIECELTDTLSESPSCTFGGLCDCELFVNAPESSGCGGVYSSTWGDVEIDSVCAAYCGCGATEPAQEAEQELADVDCMDTLADSPTCAFGGLCDCEDFVNAPESSGCGGVYSSSWGDVEINSVCAGYCGCEARPNNEGRNLQGGCTDTIKDSPSCTFGGLCDCETFVNAPESTGCGGVYTSTWGDTEINSLCPAYCGVCNDVSLEDLFEEVYAEVLQLHFRSLCKYDTTKCRTALSNLHSCASRSPGLEAADPLIQMVLGKHGTRVALETAKLGEASLHADSEEEQVVEPCPNLESSISKSGSSASEKGENDKELPVGSIESGVASKSSMSFVGVLATVAFFLAGMFHC